MFNNRESKKPIRKKHPIMVLMFIILGMAAAGTAYAAMQSIQLNSAVSFPVDI